MRAAPTRSARATWPADSSYSHFLNERVLTDEEIQLISSWVDNGSPVGDASRPPAPPRFPKDSSPDKPDLVVKMRKPVHIPGDNKDHFMVVKIPYELPEARFVRAIQFVPGNTKLLHHMNAHIVQYENKKRIPLRVPTPWIEIRSRRSKKVMTRFIC